MLTQSLIVSCSAKGNDKPWQTTCNQINKLFILIIAVNNNKYLHEPGDLGLCLDAGGGGGVCARHALEAGGSHGLDHGINHSLASIAKNLKKKLKKLSKFH